MLKIICLILSFYVVLLSATPCCNDVDCIAGRATAKAGIAATPQQKGCPACSPFFTCGSCAGFVIAKPVVVFLNMHLPEIVIKHIFMYQQPYVEEVTMSIWQPPQLG